MFACIGLTCWILALVIGGLSLVSGTAWQLALVRIREQEQID